MIIFLLEAIDGLLFKQKDIVIVLINCDIINITDSNTGSCQYSSKSSFKSGILISLHIKAFKMAGGRNIVIENI